MLRSCAFWTFKFPGHLQEIKILRPKIISMCMKVTVYRDFYDHTTFDFIGQVAVFSPIVNLDFKLFRD